MNLPLQNALKKYRAGDYQGVVRDHARAAGNALAEQNLLVVLAQSFLKLGNALEAARCYRMAGEKKGQNNAAYLLIAGNLFFRLSAIDEAHAVAKRLRALAPNDPQVLQFWYRTLRETCLFEDIAAENAALLERLRRGDPLARKADDPFSNIAWCADESINASIIAGSMAMPVTQAMRSARHTRPHDWGAKLRIGYLSDDYYDTHATMLLFQGVMMSHDLDRYEITHFCTTSAENIRKDSGKRARYPNLVPIGHLGDEDAAALIRSRNIDILIDLKGHTSGCRPNLVNLGPAPIQAAYLGYPGSANGIDCDYVISDRIVTPDSSIPHYREKLCRLPESYQANDNLFRPLPAPLDRRSLGLPEDRIVFGFFNATRKLTPETFRLTMEILKRTENSVLWILFFNNFARDNFLAAAKREGIDSERIIIAPKAKYEHHLARLPAADIALDAFPYNGHTTTSDALWAGVPVPTFKGSHFASRVSESLLTALGVLELVAEDSEGYIALACELAVDHEKRRAIRARIDANRSRMPLFDTKRFTRHLERAFEMMADRARRGLPPDLIDVPALPHN